VVDKDKDFKFAEDSEDVEVQLMEPNIAIIKRSPEDGKEMTEVGHWSLIYDQAVIVQFDDYRFTTNFKYAKKGGASLDSLDFASYDSFESMCDRTMVGLVQRKNQSGEFSAADNSCFFGE
jgi:hypothetical protein